MVRRASHVGLGGGGGAVVFHVAALFVLSAVMSANGNVLPQLFFQRLHADRKVLLLAVCLLVGTTAGIAGVWASRGAWVSRPWALAALAATLGAEAALFAVSGAAAYAALNAAAQLGANFLMNHLDHAGAARAGDGGRRLHDGAGNVARLLGMLAAPAFLGAFHDRPAAVLAALGAAFALALASAASLLAAADVSPASAAAPPPARPLDTADRLVLAFVSAVYVALYLFAANTIYLLRDVLAVEQPERRGAMAVMVCFLFAVAGNASAALARRRAHGGPRLAALLAPLPLLALAAALVATRATRSFPLFLAGCATVGLAYGVFLAEVREYVSRGARVQGKGALLAHFNNVGNVSALSAFAVMALIAAAQRGASAYPAVLAVVGGLPLLAAPLLLVGLRARE